MNTRQVIVSDGSTQRLEGGQKHAMRLAKGQRMNVRELRPDGRSVDAADVIATKKGSDLRLKYADGTELRIENFYEDCAEGACSVTLAGREAGGYTLDGSAAAGAALGEGEHLVYAHGDNASLMTLAGDDSALRGALSPLGAGTVSYLPAADSSGGIGIGALAALGGGLGLAAAGGGGGGSAAATVATVVLKGSFVAGPVLAANGLTVTAYKSDGTVLVTGTVNDDGSFTLQVKTGYAGPVLVVVGDRDGGADYWDEATGAPKDLAIDLRAATTVTGDGTYRVNVNVFTEAAVRSLGIGAGSTTLGEVGSARIAAANKKLTDALGLLDDLVTGPAPVAVVTSAGAENSSANAYGKLLAAASGVDEAGSTEATVTAIVAAVEAANPVLATSVLLLQGASHVVDKVPSFVTQSQMSLSDYFFIADTVNKLRAELAGGLEPGDYHTIKALSDAIVAVQARIGAAATGAQPATGLYAAQAALQDAIGLLAATLTSEVTRLEGLISEGDLANAQVIAGVASDLATLQGVVTALAGTVADNASAAAQAVAAVQANLGTAISSLYLYVDQRASELSAALALAGEGLGEDIAAMAADLAALSQTVTTLQGTVADNASAAAQALAAAQSTLQGAIDTLAATVTSEVERLEGVIASGDLDNANAIAGVAGDLAALTQTVATLQTLTGPDGALDLRFGAIEAQLAGIQTTVIAAIDAATLALENQLLDGVSLDFDTFKEVAVKLAELNLAIENLGRDSDSRLDAIEAQLAGIVDTVAAAISSAVGALAGDLVEGDYSTLKALSDAVKALQDASSGEGGINETLASLQTQITAVIETNIAGLQGQIDDLAGALGAGDYTTLKALSDAVKALEGIANQALLDRITALESALDALNAAPKPWSWFEGENAGNAFTVAQVFGDGASGSTVLNSFVASFAERIAGYDAETVPLIVSGNLTVAQAVALAQAGLAVNTENVGYSIRDAYTTIQSSLTNPQANAAMAGATQVLAYGNANPNSIDMMAFGPDINLRIESGAGNDTVFTGAGDQTVYAAMGADTIWLTPDEDDTSADTVVYQTIYEGRTLPVSTITFSDDPLDYREGSVLKVKVNGQTATYTTTAYDTPASALAHFADSIKVAASEAVSEVLVLGNVLEVHGATTGTKLAIVTDTNPDPALDAIKDIANPGLATQWTVEFPGDANAYPGSTSAGGTVGYFDRQVHITIAGTTVHASIVYENGVVADVAATLEALKASIEAEMGGQGSLADVLGSAAIVDGKLVLTGKAVPASDGAAPTFTVSGASVDVAGVQQQTEVSFSSKDADYYEGGTLSVTVGGETVSAPMVANDAVASVAALRAALLEALAGDRATQAALLETVEQSMAPNYSWLNGTNGQPGWSGQEWLNNGEKNDYTGIDTLQDAGRLYNFNDYFWSGTNVSVTTADLTAAGVTPLEQIPGQTLIRYANWADFQAAWQAAFRRAMADDNNSITVTVVQNGAITSLTVRDTDLSSSPSSGEFAFKTRAILPGLTLIAATEETDELYVGATQSYTGEAQHATIDLDPAATYAAYADGTSTDRGAPVYFEGGHASVTIKPVGGDPITVSAPMPAQPAVVELGGGIEWWPQGVHYFELDLFWNGKGSNSWLALTSEVSDFTLQDVIDAINANHPDGLIASRGTDGAIRIATVAGGAQASIPAVRLTLVDWDFSGIAGGYFESYDATGSDASKEDTAQALAQAIADAPGLSGIIASAAYNAQTGLIDLTARHPGKHTFDVSDVRLDYAGVKQLATIRLEDELIYGKYSHGEDTWRGAGVYFQDGQVYLKISETDPTLAGGTDVTDSTTVIAAMGESDAETAANLVAAINARIDGKGGDDDPVLSALLSGASYDTVNVGGTDRILITLSAKTAGREMFKIDDVRLDYQGVQQLAQVNVDNKTHYDVSSTGHTFRDGAAPIYYDGGNAYLTIATGAGNDGVWGTADDVKVTIEAAMGAGATSTATGLYNAIVAEVGQGGRLEGVISNVEQAEHFLTLTSALAGTQKFSVSDLTLDYQGVQQIATADFSGTGDADYYAGGKLRLDVTPTGGAAIPISADMVASSEAASLAALQAAIQKEIDGTTIAAKPATVTITGSFSAGDLLYTTDGSGINSWWQRVVIAVDGIDVANMGSSGAGAGLPSYKTLGELLTEIDALADVNAYLSAGDIVIETVATGAGVSLYVHVQSDLGTHILHGGTYQGVDAVHTDGTLTGLIESVSLTDGVFTLTSVARAEDLFSISKAEIDDPGTQGEYQAVTVRFEGEDGYYYHAPDYDGGKGTVSQIGLTLHGREFRQDMLAASGEGAGARTAAQNTVAALLAQIVAAATETENGQSTAYADWMQANLNVGTLRLSGDEVAILFDAKNKSATDTIELAEGFMTVAPITQVSTLDFTGAAFESRAKADGSKPQVEVSIAGTTISADAVANHTDTVRNLVQKIVVARDGAGTASTHASSVSGNELDLGGLAGGEILGYGKVTVSLSIGSGGPVSFTYDPLQAADAGKATVADLVAAIDAASGADVALVGGKLTATEGGNSVAITGSLTLTTLDFGGVLYAGNTVHAALGTVAWDGGDQITLTAAAPGADPLDVRDVQYQSENLQSADGKQHTLYINFDDQVFDDPNQTPLGSTVTVHVDHITASVEITADLLNGVSPALRSEAIVAAVKDALDAAALAEPSSTVGTVTQGYLIKGVFKAETGEDGDVSLKVVSDINGAYTLGRTTDGTLTVVVKQPGDVVVDLAVSVAVVQVGDIGYEWTLGPVVGEPMSGRDEGLWTEAKSDESGVLTVGGQVVANDDRGVPTAMGMDVWDQAGVEYVAPGAQKINAAIVNPIDDAGFYGDVPSTGLGAGIQQSHKNPEGSYAHTSGSVSGGTAGDGESSYYGDEPISGNDGNGGFNGLGAKQIYTNPGDGYYTPFHTPQVDPTAGLEGNAAFYGDAALSGAIVGEGVKQTYTNPAGGYTAIAGSPELDGADGNVGDGSLYGSNAGYYADEGLYTSWLNGGTLADPGQSDGNGNDLYTSNGAVDLAAVINRDLPQAGADASTSALGEGAVTGRDGFAPFTWDGASLATTTLGNAGPDVIHHFQVDHDSIALEGSLLASTVADQVAGVLADPSTPFDLDRDEYGLVDSAHSTLGAADLGDAAKVAALLRSLFAFGAAGEDNVLSTSIFAVTAQDDPGMTAIWAHRQSSAADSTVESMELYQLALIDTIGGTLGEEFGLHNFHGII